MKLRQLLEQQQRFVYHITTREAYATIKQQGILPQDAKGEWAHIGYKNKTFLFTNPDHETQGEIVSTLLGKHGNFDEWKNEQWDNFHNSLIMLTIDTTKVPGFQMAVDPNSFGDWFQTSTPIPPEAIVRVDPVEVDD